MEDLVHLFDGGLFNKPRPSQVTLSSLSDLSIDLTNLSLPPVPITPPTPPNTPTMIVKSEPNSPLARPVENSVVSIQPRPERKERPFGTSWRLQTMRCGLRLPKAVNLAARKSAYNLRHKKKITVRKHPSFFWLSYLRPRATDGKIDALVFYRDLNKIQRKQQQGKATVIPQEICQSEVPVVATNLKLFGFDYVEYII
jgi:hypothetical protein